MLDGAGAGCMGWSVSKGESTPRNCCSMVGSEHWAVMERTQVESLRGYLRANSVFGVRDAAAQEMAKVQYQRQQRKSSSTTLIAFCFSTGSPKKKCSRLCTIDRHTETGQTASGRWSACIWRCLRKRRGAPATSCAQCIFALPAPRFAGRMVYLRCGRCSSALDVQRTHTCAITAPLPLHRQYYPRISSPQTRAGPRRACVGPATAQPPIGGRKR